MNHITTYTKILKARTIFKRIQQLSWTVSKMEQKYNADELSPKEQEQLLQSYYSFKDEIKQIYDELENELNGIHTY